MKTVIITAISILLIILVIIAAISILFVGLSNYNKALFQMQGMFIFDEMVIENKCDNSSFDLQALKYEKWALRCC